jgi:hypothetical protein
VLRRSKICGYSKAAQLARMLKESSSAHFVSDLIGRVNFQPVVPAAVFLV